MTETPVTSTEPVAVKQNDISEAVRGRVWRVNHALDSRFGRRVTLANLESARNEMAELAEEHIATLAALAQTTAALEQVRGERDEARELAQVSLDILRNVSDEPMRELFGVDDMGELPSWFMRYGSQQ